MPTMQAILQILTIVLSGAAVASFVLVLYHWVADNTLKKRLTQIVRQSRAPTDTPLSKSANTHKAEPIFILVCSATPSPINKLYLLRMYCTIS